MKVEELYVQERKSQVGVTLQRQKFETEIDIFPQLNPFLESAANRGRGDESVMSELTSVQTEEKLNGVVKHQVDDSLDEFQAIPLKRIDSGPYQHRLQCSTSAVVRDDRPEAIEVTDGSRHDALLREIDAPEVIKKEEKSKSGKKESTLSRMLKGMRGEKDHSNENAEKLGTNMSLSKIFHRINPVGKTSRDSFSKVFHRIGDALQKKTDEDKESTPKEKRRTLVHSAQSRENKTEATRCTSEHCKIGEKKYKCSTPDKNVDRTT